MSSATQDDEVENARVMLGLLASVERDGGQSNDGWHRTSASPLA